MANEVTITLKAVDQASAAIQGFGAKLKAQFQSFTDYANLMRGIDTAIRAVGDAYQATVGETMDYAKAVRDVARFTGASYEEASKLIQIADDLQIEVGTLKQGMKAAVKEGISPTIEGLKAAAREYQSLNTPLEKSAWAVEKFGRAGMEMQKFLVLAPEQIDEMARSAEQLGLVLDEQTIAKTEEYRLAVDNMNDALMGLKIQVGAEVIPVLTELTTSLTNGITETERLNAVFEASPAAMAEYKQVMRDTGDATEWLAQKEAELAMQEQGVAAQAQVLGPWMSRVAGAMDEATGAAEELNPALANQSNTIEQINGKLQKYSAQLLFAKASEGLTADAALYLAERMGLVDERTSALLTSLPGLKAEFDRNRDGVIDASEATDGYSAAVLRLKNYVESLPALKIIRIQMEMYKSPIYEDNRQHGGPVAAGRVYLVGEAGPELFVAPKGGGQIIPNSRINNFAGDTFNIRNYGAGAAATSRAWLESRRRGRFNLAMGG